jgi:hypothetical protein
VYSSTLSLTSASDEFGGQRHAPTALLPGKIRYPFYKRAGGPQDQSGRVRKVSPPPGFDPRTVQPVRIVVPLEGMDWIDLAQGVDRWRAL